MGRMIASKLHLRHVLGITCVVAAVALLLRFNRRALRGYESIDVVERTNRFRPVIHLRGIHRAPLKRDRSGPPQPGRDPKPKQSIRNVVLFLEDFCFVVCFP
jgi:hypothetical protein